jgi:hypothetical protein
MYVQHSLMSCKARQRCNKLQLLHSIFTGILAALLAIACSLRLPYTQGRQLCTLKDLKLVGLTRCVSRSQVACMPKRNASTYTLLL